MPALEQQSDGSKNGRGKLSRVWVPETLRTSCGLLIFVEEAAEAVVSFDLGDLGRRAVGEWPRRSSLPQTAVRR